MTARTDTRVRRRTIGGRVLDLWIEDAGEHYFVRAFTEAGERTDLSDGELAVVTAWLRRGDLL